MDLKLDNQYSYENTTYAGAQILPYKNKHKAWNSLQKTDVFLILAIDTSGVAA